MYAVYWLKQSNSSTLKMKQIRSFGRPELLNNQHGVTSQKIYILNNNYVRISDLMLYFMLYKEPDPKKRNENDSFSLLTTRQHEAQIY
jgi:hypothetical protein